MENCKVVVEKRTVIYDWLRLLATICVVIGHSAYLKITTSFGGVDYTLPETVHEIYFNSSFFFLWRYISRWVYGFHMPLFFMLSGAVLSLKPIGKFDNIVKAKVKRLLIPYFLGGWFFMLPVKYLGNFYTKEGWKKAVTGMLSGLDSGHLWFLPALFWCLLFFVILYKILEKYSIDSIYGTLLICGVIQLVYNYIPFDILGMKKGLSYIFWFALGYVFERERQKNIQWNLSKTVIVFLVLILLQIVNIKLGILNPFFKILCGSFLLYIFADLLDRCLKDITRSKIWTIVIRNLFFVYIFHDPMEYIVLRIFMNSDYLNKVSGCFLYMFSRTILIFAISIILGECVRCVKKQCYLLINKENEGRGLV